MRPLCAPNGKVTALSLGSPVLGIFDFAAILVRLTFVIFVLAGAMDYRADIQTLHPRISRAVVEQTEIGPIPRQRAGQGESRRNKLARDTEPFCIRQNLKLSPG